MGFFKRIFGRSDGRARLIQMYCDLFRSTGMSASEARTTAQSLMESAELRSKEGGTIDLPENFGNILLEKQYSDEAAKNIVDAARQDGATDEDIRWWWNMHDLERCMMIEHDELTRFMAFRSYLKQGQTETGAAKKIRRYFPVFGSPSDPDNDGTDRPLPFELKDRINRYFEILANQEHMRSNLLAHASMNSYIRARVKDGSL